MEEKETPNVRPGAVREALEHLYENAALAQSSLAQLIPEVASIAALQPRAQALRRLLLDGIELLRPVRPTAFGDRAARSYQVLSLYYLEEMPIKQIASELGIGDRQAYRELRRAEAELGQVLAATAVPGDTTAIANTAEAQPDTSAAGLEGKPPPDSPAAEDELGRELAQLVAQTKSVNLGRALEAALVATRPLAERLGVAVPSPAGLSETTIQADEGLLRQLLIQALSLAIQAAASASTALARLEFAVAHQGQATHLRIHCPAPAREGAGLALLPVVRRLAAVQSIGVDLVSQADGSCLLTLAFGAARPHLLLVVEDNQGAIELYQRYLATEPQWQVVGVSDPRLAFEMAARLVPTAVVLDIMMPRQDGWTVLQTLRTRSETAAIPVIICSVFHDPGLGEALGASAYLKKPVSRLALLGALRRVLAEA
jgi:CheY-like chemotaxis protein